MPGEAAAGLRLAFVGMGEAGAALVSGWGAARASQISAYDIKSDDPATAPEIAARCAALGIANRPNLAEAVGSADLVFSTVTADQAVAAAEAGARHLRPGTIWCDLNSCAPSSKRKAAEVIEAAGGRYIDVAVMAPVHPKRNLVPLLISGPYAGDAAPILAALPMALRVVEGPVGRASSIKMVRSVMVKGLEALTAECVLAAVAAGVEDEVLPSLKDGHPKLDVAARAAYNFERALAHGARRAAEMEEVAVMLADLGLPNSMALATAGWERRLAGSGAAMPEGREAAGYRAFAERLLPLIRG